MKSDLPKVLHALRGRPMVAHVVETARRAGIRRLVLVVGHGRELVERALAGDGVEFVSQTEQLGTGHAVEVAERALEGHDGTVVVLSGDVPLLRAETLRRLLAAHRASGADCTVLTAVVDAPHGYGRILRAADGAVRGIVEEKNATPAEREIREINTGIYCFENPFLRSALARLRPDPRQKEYYLTDTVGIGVRGGATVRAWTAEDARETVGVNTAAELLEAERLLGEREGA
jgi:bifunctional UDP-N-acetylglucosamine pyrophosphorylase/glucosamine-1-phosphate N-acetyltransferase